MKRYYVGFACSTNCSESAAISREGADLTNVPDHCAVYREDISNSPRSKRTIWRSKASSTSWTVSTMLKPAFLNALTERLFLVDGSATIAPTSPLVKM